MSRGSPTAPLHVARKPDGVEPVCLTSDPSSRASSRAPPSLGRGTESSVVGANPHRGRKRVPARAIVGQGFCLCCRKNRALPVKSVLPPWGCADGTPQYVSIVSPSAPGLQTACYVNSG